MKNTAIPLEIEITRGVLSVEDLDILPDFAICKINIEERIEAILRNMIIEDGDIEMIIRRSSRVWRLAKLLTLTLKVKNGMLKGCLLYTSPSPRDLSTSRMPSSA